LPPTLVIKFRLQLIAMELTPDAIARVVHPTAAYVSALHVSSALCLESDDTLTSWNDSPLNPKNRIDSLDKVLIPKWRIDGCTGCGTQFFTVPLFFTKLSPMRIDTFIPEQSRHPKFLRNILGLDTAFHMKDSRIEELGVSRHILRTLEYWTHHYPGFEAVYNNLPFGSRIVFENLTTNIRDIRIQIVPTHFLERQLMSLTSLQSLWNLPASSFPELVDISQVQLLRQLYESVSLVQFETPQGLQIRTFKALTSYPKYIYHELKVLLTLPPHPNIISKPSHLVIKKCGFGGKTAVVGFMTEYQPLGTLQALLPFRRIHNTLRYVDQLKWAIQLTSALVHISEHGRFYSDLRLDNILLSATEDLVMVDFEQRGVWCGFAAPEVNYLDQVYMLAADSTIPRSVKGEYDMLMQRFMKGYEKLQKQVYQDPEHGYYIPWLCLSSKEREAATVYMLGRVLWCIFEGLSNPEVAVWQSYPHESELEFPDYRNTPSNLRMLIDQCTKGRNVSGNQGATVRKGNSLILREGDGTETMTAVQNEARRWWRKELSEAKEFLKNRESGQLHNGARSCFDRIKLKEVLIILETFQAGANSFQD